MNNIKLQSSNLYFLFLITFLSLFLFSNSLSSVTLEKADSIAKSVNQNIELLDNDSLGTDSDKEKLKTKKNDDNPYSFLLNTSGKKDKAKGNLIQQQDSWGILVIKLIFVLVFLIILIYLFVLFLKKVQSKKMFNSNLPTELYSILGNAPITFNKNFVIIKFYDKVYLLGVSDNEISVIDKIDDIEKISNIENIIPKNDSINLAKTAFSKLLKKNMKKLDT